MSTDFYPTSTPTPTPNTKHQQYQQQDDITLPRACKESWPLLLLLLWLANCHSSGYFSTCLISRSYFFCRCLKKWTKELRNRYRGNAIVAIILVATSTIITTITVPWNTTRGLVFGNCFCGIVVHPFAICNYNFLNYPISQSVRLRVSHLVI